MLAPGRARRLRRAPLLLLATAALLLAACEEGGKGGEDCDPAPVAGPAPEAASEARAWPHANRDLAGTRSTFDSGINSETVQRLGVAWEYRLDQSGSPNGSAATNPLVLGGTVYVSDLDSDIHAIDVETGERRWRVVNDAPVFGPNGVAVGWGRVFASTGGYSITAYDAACGSHLWETKLTEEGRGAVNFQPLVAGELVLAATSSLSIPGSRGFLYASIPRPERSPGRSTRSSRPTCGGIRS